MLDFNSKSKQRVLLYFFTNPQVRHHVRDLVERLDLDPGNLSKDLRHMEEEGLFNSVTEGRNKYFKLNRKYPLYTEYKSIVEKTLGGTHSLGIFQHGSVDTEVRDTEAVLF